jgi:uncharacterized membrane protein YbhN (UPF0104 family)
VNTQSDTATPSRDRLRRSLRLLGAALVSCVALGVLLWVAPPGEVVDSLSDMNPLWLLAALGLELGSCLGYVVVFRRFFPDPPRGVGRQVAWIAMGASAVLPGGNLSSPATIGWLLRHHGIGTRRLFERSGALLAFLILFGFVVNGVAGVLLLLGIGRGPHDLAHAGIPILVSIVVIGTAVAAMLAGRSYRGRFAPTAHSIATSLGDAWESLSHPHWRLLGAAGFQCLDIAALWAVCRATGHPLGVLALTVAYFVGYVATMIPMPGGLAVLDSGLAGALVLYGFSPAASVSAVLVYHAIAVWVPGLGGLIAWLPARARAAADTTTTAANMTAAAAANATAASPAVDAEAALVAGP